MPYIAIKANDTDAQCAFLKKCAKTKSIPIICKIRRIKADIEIEPIDTEDEALTSALTKDPEIIKKVIERVYNESGRPACSRHHIGNFSYFIDMEVGHARAFASRVAVELDAMIEKFKSGSGRARKQ